MFRTHAVAGLMALALITALVGAPVAMGSDTGDDGVTLATEIPINSDSAVESYNETGVARTEVAAPQMEIEISQKRKHLGMGWSSNPLKSSARNDFIRITHKEDISRTVKIPVRADYWEPFPRENLQSLTSDHTADLVPVTEDGTRYTMMTVHFNGEGQAVFPVPVDAVASYSALERTEKRTNETFGFDFGLTPTPWNHMDGSLFTENETTVRIEGDPDDLMVQYNAGDPESPTWISVPDKETSTDPYYLMERDGVDGAVYVVSTTNDTPNVRYKTEAGLGDSVSEMVRGAKHLPRRVIEGLGLHCTSIPFVGGDC